MDDTTPAIPAHASDASIRIHKDHFKIVLCMVAKENDPVSPDTKTPMTQEGHQFCVGSIELFHSIIDQDEVVAGTVIFVKGKHIGIISPLYKK